MPFPSYSSAQSSAIEHAGGIEAQWRTDGAIGRPGLKSRTRIETDQRIKPYRVIPGFLLAKF